MAVHQVSAIAFMEPLALVGKKVASASKASRARARRVNADVTIREAADAM